MVLDWGLWGGGAAAGVLADYVDIKMQPLSSRVTNSELLALAALLVDSAGWADHGKPVYMRAADGAAGWGSGMLAAGIARRRLLATVPTVTTQPTAPASAASTPASNPATMAPGGVTGVPASGGSAAFDLPQGGY